MGLFAVITGDDLELPTELSGTAIVPVDSDANGEDDVAWNNDTTEVVVEIDYSDAFAAFADTFYSVATDLVPIDTGYLLSTISSSSDDWSITAEADADYAQYVEYGTWKMDAQPYFAPALNQAWDETSYLFEEAINQAQQELQSEIDAIQEGLGDNPDTGFGGGSFLGGILGAILGGIIVGLIRGFLGMFSSTGGGGGRAVSRSGISGGGDLESFIEIT